MKKKFLAIVASLVMMMICSGCFNNQVKIDLESYLSFEMGIEKETEALSLDFMGNVSNASTKDEALKILNDGIEKLLDIRVKQTQYQPGTKEVQDIHEKKIRVIDTTLVTLQETVQLLNSSKTPQEQLNNLKKRQQQITKITKEYKKAILTLAEQKKVEVKLKFE